MPQQVFGAAAAVSMLNRAFYNASPSNAIFKNQVEQIGTTEESQILFANQFAAGLANVPAQELVEQVLGNMGLLPNDALVEAGVEALEAYGPGMYGAVVLSFAKLMATLENATGEQEIFRDAAKAWNKEVGQSYLYSNNPANTEDFEGDFGGDTPTTGLTLSHGADNLVGGAGDDVFVAPVTQNGTGSGALANTFETGDVIDGGAGRNTLKVDLIGTGTVSDFGNEVAISATTQNIQEVYIRQQTPQIDWRVNNSTIDAEKMAGVEQWWTDNSRSGVQIEDIRTDTANTTFGMRLTDPGVSYNAYFNALYLEGDMTATSAVTLNIYEGPAGSPDAAKQLKDISVREINFKVAGETVSLSSQAIKDADTWDELEVALNEALETVGVADTITVTNRGNGQFVFEDTQAREFQVNSSDALVVAVANNITFTNSLAVGRDEVVGPVVSNAVLDGAGNGSQGGTLNLGAMSGLRGVEELNLSVDRESHLQSITSFNRLPGQYNDLRNGEANEFLEVVNLSSTGAKGDLTVGRSTDRLDGRVDIWGDKNANGFADADRDTVGDGLGNSGFINLREFNAADFAGDLNIAVTLDNNVDSRYLKNATEAVNFTYTGGAQDDIFNIADISTTRVSTDTDFAMQVNMGAGDDRLILNVPGVRAVKVDGGTGDNSIVVSQSHGTNAGNTFAEFKNFQTYEVEGTGAAVRNDTTHNFASMAGVKNVVIATDDGPADGAAVPPLPRGDNTTLINLEADQDVTITGKNQTAGNNSAADQFFGTITLTNDAGADRTITLDNTARLANATNGVRQSGVLTVDNLTTNTDPAAGVGATKNVTIESNGVRNTANAIASFNGRDVEKLTLTGTQDLTLNVATLANQAGAGKNTAMTVDGSALNGNLNLAVSGAMLNNNTVAPAQTDTFTGTAGAADTLMLHGALNVDSIKASGFETVQLGSWGGAGTAVDAKGATAPAPGNSDVTMFGDLAINEAASGDLNVAGLGVSNYVLANLSNTTTLEGLASGATVSLGDAARNEAGNRVAGQTVDQQINLLSSATKGVDSITLHRLGNIDSATVTNIALGEAGGNSGFKTINLVVDHAIDQAANLSTLSNINLDVGSQARTLNVTGGTSPSNTTVQAAAIEIQTLDFAGLVVPAGGGTVVIGGVNVALAAGDDGNAIATKVQAALNGQTLNNQVPANTVAAALGPVAANTTVVQLTYDATDGNVAPVGITNAAVLGGNPVIKTVAQGDIAFTTTGADVLDLSANQLLNSLEVIDLSGFNGQVLLTMEQGAIAGTQTDVNFVLSKYNADITLSNGAGGAYADITHNSVFDFTGAGTVQMPTQWTVANVVNAVDAGGGANHGDVNNNTLFDVRDLGIQNYAQLKVLYVDDGDIATDAYGNVLAAGQAVVRSESEHLNGNVTWEIVVTGIAGAGGLSAAASALGEANFGF